MVMAVAVLTVPGADIGEALAGGFGFAGAGGVLTTVMGAFTGGASFGGASLARLSFLGAAVFGSGSIGVGFTFAVTFNGSGSAGFCAAFTHLGAETGAPASLTSGALIGLLVAAFRDGMARMLGETPLELESIHQASIPKITTAAAAQTGQTELRVGER